MILDDEVNVAFIDKTGLHCAYDSETNEKCYYRLKGWISKL